MPTQTTSPIQLSTPLENIFRLQADQKKALQKLGLETVSDLIYYFPNRYDDAGSITRIGDLFSGQQAVVFGTVGPIKTKKAFIKKIPMAEATISDETGSVKAVWFHQPYIAKLITEGAWVRLEGKVSGKENRDGHKILSFTNPEIESISKVPIGIGQSLFSDEGLTTSAPVYPETKGVTSRWIFHALQRIFKSGILETLQEIIPQDIIERYHLPTLKTALIWIHTPQKENDHLAARKRFAFQEIFLIQLAKIRDRRANEKNPSYVVDPELKEIDKFVKRFGFQMTEAQQSAIDTILGDMKKGYPMSRLLEGDVGSGKTAVAATIVYATTIAEKNKRTNVLEKIKTNSANLQTTYMAPTEILARQHFQSFINYFKHLPINIALLTGNGCEKFPSKINPAGTTNISRTQLLKWVANGEISILIGTHALIQKTVKFKNLACVVIDEQHRFGIKQRQELVQKEKAEDAHKIAIQKKFQKNITTEKTVIPHLLSMTATPIPRTLALTIYGDLDLTLLDQMPAGRKPVITEIVLPSNRNATYEKIRAELKAGRQCYIICPRIDEPDPTKEQALLAKSVKTEAARLQKDIFPEYRIDIMHSKMKPTDKDSVMKDFSDHRVDILVSTSVVEVGVNVPNATMIVIEGAERFGLSQLHQLRGRVIRSNHQAYCYVFTESKTETTIDRLKALTTAKNGFELSEMDLALRGTGALYAGKQWGVTDIAMEALKNIKMVEAARTEATKIIDTDPTLDSYPLLKKTIADQDKIHFE